MDRSYNDEGNIEFTETFKPSFERRSSLSSPDPTERTSNSPVIVQPISMEEIQKQIEEILREPLPEADRSFELPSNARAHEVTSVERQGTAAQSSGSTLQTGMSKAVAQAIRSLQGRIREMEQRLQEKSKVISSLEEQVRHEKELAAAARGTYQENESRLRTKLQKLSTKTQEVANNVESKYQQQVFDLKASLEGLRAERDSMNAVIQSLDQKLKDKNGTTAILEEKNRIMNNEVESLREEYRNQLFKAQEAHRKIAEEHKSLNKEYQALGKDYTNLEMRYRLLERRLSESEENARRANEMRAESSKALEKAEQRLTEMSKSVSIDQEAITEIAEGRKRAETMLKNVIALNQSLVSRLSDTEAGEHSKFWNQDQLADEIAERVSATLKLAEELDSSNLKLRKALRQSRRDLCDCIRSKGVEVEYPWVKSLRAEPFVRPCCAKKVQSCVCSKGKKVRGRAKSPLSKGLREMIAAAAAEAAAEIVKEGRGMIRRASESVPKATRFADEPVSAYASSIPTRLRFRASAEEPSIYSSSPFVSSSSQSPALSEIRAELAKEYADLSRRYQDLCARASVADDPDSLSQELKHVVDSLDRKSQQLKLLRGAQAANL